MKELITLLKRKTITMGPPARCGRHDITLLGYTKSNVTAFGKCPNHHIWPRFSFDWCQDTSDSWCLRRKGCNTIWRDGVAKFLGNELWKQVLNHEFIIKPRRGWGGGWWTQRQFIEIFKMDFHTYVNKEITFVRSNDVMRYARGSHTQLNIGWKVHPKYGLRYHDQC